MVVINNIEQRWKNLFIILIHIVAESGLQVKRLKEYIIGYEVRSLSLFKFILWLN